MTFERILSYFQVMKRGTGKAQCICPAHVDREASLTLTDGNDRALIMCHAGCSAEKVVDAAGLKMSDLFYGDGLAKERWRAYIENREKRKIEAVYNYASINGDYAYTKVRLEGKKMLFGILSNERFAYGLNGKNKKTFNAVYGSISSIKRAIERKEPVFIPEGEKDVNTLVKKGYTAFSCGGANDWNKNVSELCKDADVIVLADNDDPGKKLASTVVRDLKGTAKSIKIIIPMPEVPKADITDYFEAGHTVEEFENLIRNVDDTEKVCTDVQQDQKQDVGKKRAVTQKSKDEVAGGPALVFKFLDCNYDEDGNVKLAHSISAGLDYPGVGPEHAYLRDTGRAEYVSVTDTEAMEALLELCKLEGIIPAIESAHALAYTFKMAKNMKKDDIIVVCLSGRGDKDVHTVEKYLNGEETNK